MICRVAYNCLERNKRIYFCLERAFLVSAPSTIVDCAAIALIEQTHDDKTQSSVLVHLDCERGLCRRIRRETSEEFYVKRRGTESGERSDAINRSLCAGQIYKYDC